MDLRIDEALALFAQAMSYVTSSPYHYEAEWQRQRVFSSFSESDLLRELAWVVLCSGFREAAVRKIFDYISLCFFDWESSKQIVDNIDTCKSTANSAFRNRKKIDSILDAAIKINNEGFENVRRRIWMDPLTELQKFRHIGPVTCWHLAKNLGLNVAKPDRHIVRLSRLLGYQDPNNMCESISCITGEPTNVVDIVLWRYLAEHPGVFEEFGKSTYRAD